MERQRGEGKEEGVSARGRMAAGPFVAICERERERERDRILIRENHERKGEVIRGG